jgi:hypothetical protein
MSSQPPLDLLKIHCVSPISSVYLIDGEQRGIGESYDVKKCGEYR